MKEQELQEWRANPLTKEFFRLFRKRLDEVNADLVNGKLLREGDKFATDVNYYSAIGYNKAFTELTEIEYRDLVGAELESQGEENDEKLRSVSES